ncbi:aminoglycoside phosphotransferase family protein [Agromyces sp. MMS24-JH15]|uniref:aminoglycoside phosphotransferase family protein n=1 Tax=Agromyces sp. MMS24-JH15 TaxID=3243765 RepID=UPI003747C49E
MSDIGPVDPGHAADAAWLRRWRLRADGDLLVTASSTLQPVRTARGEPAMLKVARLEEEARGNGLLVALAGRGAARVLRWDGHAVLIERATGGRDLVRMVQEGEDDEATRILVATAERLHRATPAVLALEPVPELVDLRTWFRELFARADDLTPLHRRGADVAARLLDDPRDEVVLHGDLHHGNVLDFGTHGWLAIDPKGLIGESTFDLCNPLCNPSHERALLPGRLARQFAVAAEASGVEAGRLADWLLAWCALSSAWFAADDDPQHAASAAAIGELALGLGRDDGA